MSEHWGRVSLLGGGSRGQRAQELAGRAEEEQQALAGSAHTREYTREARRSQCPGTQAAGPAMASPPTSLHNKPACQAKRPPAAAGRRCWECAAASASGAPSPRQRRRLQGGAKGRIGWEHGRTENPYKGCAILCRTRGVAPTWLLALATARPTPNSVQPRTCNGGVEARGHTRARTRRDQRGEVPLLAAQRGREALCK